MQKIECTEIKETINCVKKFFTTKNIRIMTTDSYVDQDGRHKHDFCDQIIFVMSGALLVEDIVVMDNEFINIPAGEWHKVESLTKETKIIVLKVVNDNVSSTKILKEDYIREE